MRNLSKKRRKFGQVLKLPLSGRLLAEIPHLRAYARVMTNDRCKRAPPWESSALTSFRTEHAPERWGSGIED